MSTLPQFIAATFGVASEALAQTGNAPGFSFKMVSNQKSQIVTYAEGQLIYSKEESLHVPGPLGGFQRYIPAQLSTPNLPPGKQYFSDSDTRDPRVTNGVPFDPIEPEDLGVHITYTPPDLVQVRLIFLTQGAPTVTFQVDAMGGVIYGSPDPNNLDSPIYLISVGPPPAPVA